MSRLIQDEINHDEEKNESNAQDNPRLDGAVLSASEPISVESKDVFLNVNSVSNKTSTNASSTSGYVVLSDISNGNISSSSGSSPSTILEEQNETSGGKNGKNDQNKAENSDYQIVNYHNLPLHSMESGLHSLLQSMHLPINSEVLITPLISRSVIKVIEMNGLIIKSMDINPNTMEPKKKIKALITKKTKVVIIGKLFSFYVPCNIGNDVLVIKDCTETYSCDESEQIDVKMYNFETKIGAMFQFKEVSLMQRVQNVVNCYQKQSFYSYLWLMIGRYLMQLRTKNKYILMICHYFNLAVGDVCFGKGMNAKQRCKSYQIQPSSYLIKSISKSMKSRLKMQNKSMKIIKEKRKILISELSEMENKVTIIDKKERFSLFCPLIIHNKNDKKRIIDRMKRCGYNIIDGGYRLISTFDYSFNHNVSASDIVFLPWCNNLKSFKKMLKQFKKLLMNKKKNNKRMRHKAIGIMLMKIFAAVFILRYVWMYLLIIFIIAYWFMAPKKMKRHKAYNGVRHKRILSKDKVSIIITGCTGFVGEVLVKDLLDSYPSEQISVYLIIRAKKKLSAMQRAQNIFGDKYMNDQNVFIIDAELETFDMNEVMNQIGKDTKITHIIHSAAIVKFNESHSVTAKTNILCTLKMKQLSDAFNAKFVYISTAFVNGANSKKKVNNINASPVHIYGDMNAQKLCKLMLENRCEEIDEYMKEYHIENNYILSKIIAENLIGTDSIIVRPSIISPAWNYPEPAWSGRSASTITFILAGICSRLVRMPARVNMFRTQIMTIIPVDFVSQCIINHMNDAPNSIILAALNTQSKYNKAPSWFDFSYDVAESYYFWEILSSFEVVIVRFCFVFSGLSSKLFRILGYMFNEIFAPKKYAHLLSVVYEYEHFTFTSFNVEDGITPKSDFDAQKYISMVVEKGCDLAKKPLNDLAANIPIFKYDENVLVSLSNMIFSYILSKVTNSVIIKDMENLKALSQKSNIVFLPTHRSFFDFLIICKICLKFPTYGLSMPLSFATSKFKQSPLIALCMKLMNAVFIDASSNQIKNGMLKDEIMRRMDDNNVYQLFIEGTRSRNRSFLKPFHGVLSSLAECMDICIVPITINYEKIPEQNSFFREFNGEKCSFSVLSLIGWFYDVIIRNNVFLGDINVRIGNVIEVKQREYEKEYFMDLTTQIQKEQMRMINVTKYHIHYFENDDRFKHFEVEKMLISKGCKVHSSSIDFCKLSAMNEKEIYILSMQFVHFLDEHHEIAKYVQSLDKKFNGTQQPIKNEQKLQRINVGNECLGYWGYGDSKFCLKGNALMLKGSRYEISDVCFDKTISFFSQLSGLPLLKKQKYFPVHIRLNEDEQKNDENKQDLELMNFLHNVFGKKYVTKDVYIRYRHGTGHTVSDMLHLRIENKSFRIPEIVIYPQCKSQLIKLVKNCKKFNVCLIPYGGGTNVTHSLWCNPKEKRRIISVDMSMMNKLIEINRKNQIAHIGAGITGKKLEAELNGMGLTCGHYPDSYEFSTLGGWIATYASGMKRSKYGNIEDIVIDFEVITSNGLIHRNLNAFGRVSAGSNYLSQFYGSEGTLGIIISATIRVHPLPDIIRYDSIIFPSWIEGLSMVKMMKQMPNNCRPATFRLVDNTQFKLSQTLKQSKKLKSFLSKLYVTKWRGFDVNKICAATIVYEGNKNEIAMQQKIMNDLIKQNDGMRGGESSGKAGFNLTFAIAYLRDFLLESFGILAESFETFIPWDKLDGFKESLHENILQKHEQMKLIGNPFLSSRISQVYNEGVCLYLYYGFMVDELDENALSVFDEMEDFIRKEMMQNGGSISHHHGIGKLRANILKNDVSSKQMIELAKSIKKAFDPDNIFVAGNGLLYE